MADQSTRAAIEAAARRHAADMAAGDARVAGQVAPPAGEMTPPHLAAVFERLMQALAPTPVPTTRVSPGPFSAPQPGAFR